MVHVTESLFSPLGDSIQRGDVEHAEVILEAEPDHERAKVFRLRFAMLRIRHATNPVQNHVETPNAARDLHRTSADPYRALAAARAIFLFAPEFKISLWA